MELLLLWLLADFPLFLAINFWVAQIDQTILHITEDQLGSCNMCTVLKHAAVIQRTLIEQVYKLIANLIAQAKYVGSVAVVVRTVLFKAEKKEKNKNQNNLCKCPLH